MQRNRPSIIFWRRLLRKMYHRAGDLENSRLYYQRALDLARTEPEKEFCAQKALRVPVGLVISGMEFTIYA